MKQFYTIDWNHPGMTDWSRAWFEVAKIKGVVKEVPHADDKPFHSYLWASHSKEDLGPSTAGFLGRTYIYHDDPIPDGGYWLIPTDKTNEET